MTASAIHADTPALIDDAGVFLLAGQFPGGSSGAALEDALAYGVAAERAGFDSAWIAEHHFVSYGVCPSATVFAGMLLGRTTRLSVGTAACILSARHPVALGEEAVLLDRISGGRFRLGVGRGGPWAELEVFGTGLARYEHGFPEALDLLREWLSGAVSVGTVGEFFGFRTVPVVPAVEWPMPVWVAATSDSTVDLAAERGAPLLLGMHIDDSEKYELLRRYAKVAEQHGHDPAEVPHAGAHLIQVADSFREGRDRLRSAMPHWLARGLGQYIRLDGSQPGPSAADPAAYVEKLIGIHPVGTPDECVERLMDSAERTGLRRFLLMVEGAGDRVVTLENIARLGAEVLPALRGGDVQVGFPGSDSSNKY